MNSKPNNTAELIKQLKETDRTIKVSDVVGIVSRVFAQSKSDLRAMTGDELSLRLFSMLSAIMLGITAIGMTKEEATELAMRIVEGDLQKMIESEPGGEA